MEVKIEATYADAAHSGHTPTITTLTVTMVPTPPSCDCTLMTWNDPVSSLGETVTIGSSITVTPPPPTTTGQSSSADPAF